VRLLHGSALFSGGLVLLLAAAVPAAPSLPEGLPRGELVEKVLCAADPKQSYALYLPSRYDPARGWPILYLYDARGRGKLPASLFREAAETYGWILVGSNNTRSDDPKAGNAAVVETLWRETHERFSIDERRAYAGGFSGGARLACALAQSAPGAVAGVIGAGGGFPDSRPPEKSPSFPFFGAAGEEDFNYYELKTLDAKLEKLGFPHRLEIFEGGHAWPPEELCAEAIEWMEILAMASGAPRDERRLQAIFEKRLSRAREREAAGKLLEAYRDYVALARDFRPLRDLLPLETRIAALEKGGTVRKLAARDAQRDAADLAELRRFDAALRATRSGEDPPILGKLVHELRIPELRRKAAGAGRAEALSARRLLASLFVQTGFYLPRELLEKGNFTRAILLLSVATEIRPESPWVWYDRACAWARSGNRRKALEDLRTAVARGFRDRAHMEKDPDLAALRDEPALRELLRGMPEK
jgi:predicted esterase